MRALLLIDIQNDFMPNGALPIADGNEVVPVANRLIPAFDLVVATQDWHPQDHGSFATMHPGRMPGEVVDLGGVPQVLWPPHGVQGTRGAEFHPALDVESIDHVVRKGTDPGIDSYSGFFDNHHLKATGLDGFLRQKDVDAITVTGLATDYCVKFTVLDGLQLGYEVTLVEDGCRAVDLEPGDGNKAVEEVRRAGAFIVSSVSIVGPEHAPFCP